MTNTRMNQIIEPLVGLGTKPDVMYTNQEVVDHLKALQSALAQGVFEKTHAENLRDRDIMIHFEALAKEYGLDGTETYHRFKANMDELGYTIGSFIKGMCGERVARKALKLLSFDKSVRILYNVQLEDEDAQAEYDAIVVAPYGMFVIEVKNWGTAVKISPNGLLIRDDSSDIIYDLPGRMSVKEALLREYLQEIFPAHYHNLLLFPNERVQIQDNYHQVPISCGAGISYQIKSYAKTGESLTAEQVEKIAETILANHKEQRALCSVRCDEIIADYAKLMVQIEEASGKTGNIHLEPKAPTPANVVTQTERPWFRQINWGNVAASIAAVALPGLAATIAITHKR